jgi:flagellar biosynthetic protein FlhB
MVAFTMVKGQVDAMPALMQVGVAGILAFFGQVAFKVCVYTCLAMIVLAALDYIFQRWQHEKDLRMTKQEIKDEFKQTEGDPKIKARIRSIQMEMARRRMMDLVPEATVVITNPTHLAVALKFDAATMAAPQVVAKGAGFIAGRIRTVAAEHGVPVVEQKPLARTLFKGVDIGAFIPADLYQAVAEILAYVYKLKEFNGQARP